MHYLIDGHNLIAKTPDIDLADEHDEAQLILWLKGWTAASRKRIVTVIFDSGLPGGRRRSLSSSQINVIFATYGQTADALIIKRIYQTKDPRAFTVVSNDHAILDAAKTRRMPIMRSDAFVQRYWTKPEAKPTPTPAIDEADNPQISQAEVAEWLDLFGPVPERKPKPKPTLKPKSKKTVTPKPTPKRRKRLTTDKQGERQLSQDEVSEWLELFGPVPKRKTKPTLKPKPQKTAPPKPTPKGSQQLTTDKQGKRKLSQDELSEWLDLFGS